MLKRREFLFHLTSGAVGLAGATCTTQAQDLYQMPNYSSAEAELLTDSKPAADGFYFPAEWEPHQYTIMILPPAQNWKGSGIPLREVRGQWAAVANALSEFETVMMVVHPADRKHAKRLLSREIEQVEFPVNDGWSRDSGPMFLVNDAGERRVAGFTFNGWGAKFPPYDDDAMLKARLCEHLGVPMYPIDLCLEGGAVAVDGDGTVLTTEQCLLNKNRNANRNRDQIETLLNESLGTSKVLWLAKGLEPDPITDGHIDGIAAFAAPGVVLLHTTRDRNDPNYRICQDAKRRLDAATDAMGRRLRVIEIPLSGNVPHMNFYIANDCVLVPVAKDPRHDKRPLSILKEVFADREVIGIDGRVLAEGGGGIHCITQQVPMT